MTEMWQKGKEHGRKLISAGWLQTRRTLTAVLRLLQVWISKPAYCALAGVCLAAVVVAGAPVLRRITLRVWAATCCKSAARCEERLCVTAREFMAKRCEAIERRIRSGYPSEHYLIVSTSDNRFLLCRDTVMVRSGMCSTGSMVLLRSADGKREWVFQTPRGMFRVLDKKENPVWVMPDWAFVEEGRPVPTTNFAERVQHGVLGDYALVLGRGYLIHGTLYQRFLGLPATHGCVRLGDEDLKVVYHALAVGGRVYIY